MEITDSTFKQEVLNQKRLVLVDFWATWCGPCKMIVPILEQVSEHYKERVKVCKINVEENSESAKEYGIMSLPTILFFKNGKIFDQITGQVSKNSMIKKVEELLE
jgi:thioredoxin 1